MDVDAMLDVSVSGCFQKSGTSNSNIKTIWISVGPTAGGV